MQRTHWTIRAIQLLSVAGIVLAYYLYLFHEGQVLLNCEVNSWWDCSQVSGPTGRFSSIGPLPVALIGLLGYCAIFGTIWLADLWQPAQTYRRDILLALIGFAFLFSLGLTVLEAFVIHAFCQYCVFSFGVITAMLLLILLNLKQARTNI